MLSARAPNNTVGVLTSYMLSNNILYVVYLYGDRWYAQWMAHKELKVDKTNEALEMEARILILLQY